MISLDLTKSSEVRKAGDRPNYVIVVTSYISESFPRQSPSPKSCVREQAHTSEQPLKKISRGLLIYTLMLLSCSNKR